MRRLGGVLFTSLALAACGGDPPTGGADAGPIEVADAADAPPGVAPPGAVAGEVAGGDENPIDVPAGGVAIVRIEAVPGEHVGLRFDFAPGPRGVVMAVARWDGAQPVDLGQTDAGAGLRVLAILDQDEPRTFWVRIEAQGDAVTGALHVTRTPFADGLACAADCDRLLQLPLPNAPTRDGYDVSAAVFRYQFGRRDLLMFLRAAGRQMTAAGYAPFRPEDLSDWEGRTPGVDVGAPRHASHQRGKDVDLSLYGTDNAAPWRTYCVTRSVSGGRECTPGSRLAIFDAYRNARLIGAFYASQRVTMSFLDRELIEALIPGAAQAVDDGAVAPELLPLFSDGVHVQHWPNHDNHVHLRISEATSAFTAVPDFEAP